MARRLLADIARGLARCVALAGLLSVLLTVCGQLLARLWWPLELASHFTVYYLAALLPAAVACLTNCPTRRPRLAMACVAAWVLNAALVWPYLVPTGDRPAADIQTKLRVMSLNVLTSNRRHEDVLRLVEQTDPDVLALIEVDRSWMDALGPLFEKYPTSRTLPRSDNFGVALFSKLPAESIESVELANSEVPSIVARLPTAVGPVTVLATHPLPPIGQTYATLRNNHLQAIARWAGEQEGRAVVVGDLNVTPWSPYFRSLLAGGVLRDSGVGQGIRPTWFVGGGLIGLSIDHVLHTTGLEALNRKVGPDVGSDHRAVIVDFAVTAR